MKNNEAYNQAIDDSLKIVLEQSKAVIDEYHNSDGKMKAYMEWWNQSKALDKVYEKIRGLKKEIKL